MSHITVSTHIAYNIIISIKPTHDVQYALFYVNASLPVKCVLLPTWCAVYPVNRLGIMVVLWYDNLKDAKLFLRKYLPGCPDLWPPCWWEQKKKNIQWWSRECHMNCLLLEKVNIVSWLHSWPLFLMPLDLPCTKSTSEEPQTELDINYDSKL